VSRSASAGPGAGVRVREIAAGESMKPFIELSWRINAADPAWVPPLRMALEPVLDRRRHPFHQHADVAYFVAERAGEPVGRIAACVNHRYNEFHEASQGTFGFFEAVDDEGVAGALLSTAADWLRPRGMTVMRGPFNFSTNDEFSSPGVLVDGFDTHPVVMMSHNPPYYGGLMESAGLAKAKDLLAYWMDGSVVPERLSDRMDRLTRRAGVTLRSLRTGEMKEEVARIQEIYNAAWSRNWGFVPMTPAEFAHLARELRPVVEPRFVLLAEKGDEPIGFLLALPDLNHALKHVRNGRLLPLGLLRFLWHRRRIDVARILTLGLKPGYQHLGIGAAMYTHLLHVGREMGYRAAEGSWILEDNHEMRSALEKLGCEAYRRYRVYERGL
jgi:GNAT superfamily N-acetyltransferase